MTGGSGTTSAVLQPLKINNAAQHNSQKMQIRPAAKIADPVNKSFIDSPIFVLSPLRKPFELLFHPESIRRCVPGDRLLRRKDIRG